MVKNLPANAGDVGLIPGSGKFPWRRKWQPTPVFLPGEFHGQRSLARYNPWGRKESDMTKGLTLSITRRWEVYTSFLYISEIICQVKKASHKGHILCVSFTKNAESTNLKRQKIDK